VLYTQLFNASALSSTYLSFIKRNFVISLTGLQLNYTSSAHSFITLMVSDKKLFFDEIYFHVGSTHVVAQCLLTFFGFVHPCCRLLHSHSLYCECMAYVTVMTWLYTTLLLSDPHKLGNSFKKSRIRINCQEMGSYEENKCRHPIFLTNDGTELENNGLSENQTPDLCHCRHNVKTTKNDRKLWIFTAYSRLLITELLPNFSDQLFMPQIN